MHAPHARCHMQPPPYQRLWHQPLYLVLINLARAGAKTSMLKQDVRMFKHDSVYFTLIAINLALRISWTYKLSAHLRHLKWFVFAMTALEIFRRFLWTFVRIENELRKISNRRPGMAPLIPHDWKGKDGVPEEPGAVELTAQVIP